MCSDQSTSNPMFEGENGTTSAPSGPTQAPSEPSRDQLAPPAAITTAPASTGSPSRTGHPSENPSHRQRVRTSTPSPSSRPSQARSSGEAFIARGNTRPDDPVNTSCPSPSDQPTASPGPNPSSAARTPAIPVVTAPRNTSAASSLVRFSPERPAIRNLRPTDGILSATSTRAPAPAAASAAASPAGPPPTTSTSRFAIPMKPAHIRAMEDNHPTCALCHRPIPPGVRQSVHHLIPRLRGGKNGATVLLHQICGLM